MDDVQFNCPTCRLPLVVSANMAGGLATCPKCKTTIEIPGRQRVHAYGTPPPFSPEHRQDYRDYDLGFTLRTRNCTLAYIALGLVCVSFLTGFLLLVPGIVCAHIALAQCDRDPNMTGRGFAVGALIAGYVVVGFIALCIVGFMLMIAASQS